MLEYIQTKPNRTFRCWGKKIFLVTALAKKPSAPRPKKNILDSDTIFTQSPRPQNLDQKKRPYRSTSKKT